MTDIQDDPAYHFQVVRRAIDLIDAGQAPTLDALARQMCMSPGHLQRIFSAWAGVSPKRYGQYLALDHARRLLAA
ncbi:MAG: AraC family transcriptional regulator, partial [Pseudomonadota bacterium]